PKTRWVTGKGLELNSANKLFRLQLRPRGQFLYQLNDKLGSDDERDRSHAMMLRRARLVSSGHMWGKQTTFKMELAFAPRDLGMTDNKSGNPPVTNKDNTVSRSLLLDFYVQFKQLRDLNVRVGQYKVPYSRQRVISSGNLMMVDRAITNAEFTVDRDIGIDIRSKDLFGLNKKLRYYLGVYAGEGHSSYASNDFGMMYLGRVEVLPMGNFKDYHESDHGADSKARLSIGLGYAYVENAKGNKGIIGKRPKDGGTTDTQNLTADIMFKVAGLSFQTEYYWRKGRRQQDGKLDVNTGEPLELEKPRDGWGLMSQAGYLLPNTDFELSARYALVRGAGQSSSLADNNEVGGALSYYFASHSLKLQADLLHFWAEDFGQGDNQFRLQLQAAF
ncbi:MAG: hypothetical protein CMH53_04640, partial [Myxococcales bacterium]|nr:hypothetical protein [Myxococcales bacterium]